MIILDEAVSHDDDAGALLEPQPVPKRKPRLPIGVHRQKTHIPSLEFIDVEPTGPLFKASAPLQIEITELAYVDDEVEATRRSLAK